MLSSTTIRRVSLTIFPRFSAAAAAYALVAIFLLQQQQHGWLRWSSFLADAQGIGIRIKHFIPITYARDWGETILCGVNPGPIKDMGFVATRNKCARICADYDWPCSMIHVFPSQRNSSVKCLLYNYESVDLFLPVVNCTGLKIDNDTLNDFTPSSQVHVTNRNCSYPFTYNGKLYYHCTIGYPNVTTTQEPYFCFLKNRTAVLCDFPDYVEPSYIIPNATLPSGWSTPLMGINGWSIILQKLQYITTNRIFDKPWQDYKVGFGKVNDNFWIGLENIYQLTNANSYVLRIEMEWYTGQWFSVEYWNFRISSEATNYTLLYLDGATGDAGDSMSYSGGDYPVQTQPSGSFMHVGMQFTTKDRANDNCKYTSNCPCAHPARGAGGWWWNACAWACLSCEGSYFCWTSIAQMNNLGMWAGVLRQARMMLRPQ